MTQLLVRHRQTPTAPQVHAPAEVGTARGEGLRPEGWYALSLDDLWLRHWDGAGWVDRNRALVSLDDLWLRHWDGAGWVDRNRALVTVLSPGPGVPAASRSAPTADPVVVAPPDLALAAPPVVPTERLPRTDGPSDAQVVGPPMSGVESSSGDAAGVTRSFAKIRGTIGLTLWVAAALFVGVGVAILGIVLTT